MNLIFSFRTILAMMTIMWGIVFPRILNYFGLSGEPIATWISPPATFLIVLLAAFLFCWGWIKQKKFTLWLIIAIFVVAFLMTFYFCSMSLPW